jgi:hypothetical protein
LAETLVSANISPKKELFAVEIEGGVAHPWGPE